MKQLLLFLILASPFVACGQVKTPTLSIPFLPKTEKASPILAKRMEFARFVLDWDGMTPLASRPKQEVRQILLDNIKNDCPDYLLINEGENAEEESDKGKGGIQDNSKIYRNFYWVRYRCNPNL